LSVEGVIVRVVTTFVEAFKGDFGRQTQFLLAIAKSQPYGGEWELCGLVRDEKKCERPG
jgi:hypothetical protein